MMPRDPSSNNTLEFTDLEVTGALGKNSFRGRWVIAAEGQLQWVAG